MPAHMAIIAVRMYSRSAARVGARSAASGIIA